MEMTQTQRLPVPQSAAWAALNDVALLQQCIPGCESIEPDGENAYQVVLTAAIGPVKARFRGRMALEDIAAPDSYTIRFEGQGGAAGFGNGTAQVRLEPDGDETVLSYTVQAQVGGKIAQIGSRLVDGAARKMADSFFTCFRQAVGAGSGAATDDEAAADAANSDSGAARGDPAGDTAAQQPSSAGAAEGQTEGQAEGEADGQTKRKGLWTAWISKS